MKCSASTLLAALCMLLAAALAALWIGPERVWTPPPPHAAPDTPFLSLSPGATAPLAAADAVPDASAEIAARPLFNPGRRPAARAAAPVSTTTQAGIALIGVFRSESASGAILIVDGAARRVRTGQHVAGMTLVTVDEAHARLVTDDGSEVELELQRGLTPPTSAEIAPSGLPEPVPADRTEQDAD